VDSYWGIDDIDLATDRYYLELDVSADSDSINLGGET